jgi:hypothetical protein
MAVEPVDPIPHHPPTVIAATQGRRRRRQRNRATLAGGHDGLRHFEALVAGVPEFLMDGAVARHHRAVPEHDEHSIVLHRLDGGDEIAVAGQEDGAIDLLGGADVHALLREGRLAALDVLGELTEADLEPGRRPCRSPQGVRA